MAIGPKSVVWATQNELEAKMQVFKPNSRITFHMVFDKEKRMSSLLAMQHMS